MISQATNIQVMELQVKRIFILTILVAYFWSIQGQRTPFDAVVAQDGSGNFRRITDAISAAPNYSSSQYTIKIRKGFYAETITIEKWKSNLVLLGDGMYRTIISGNKSYGGGVITYKTSTVGIHGPGFIGQGITFENVAGPHMQQAVAVKIEADNVAFFKCRFQGYQDTLCTKSGMQFFRECDILGTVDFIFGDARVVFQNCMIYVRRPLPGQSNTITAQGRDLDSDSTGTVLQNCTITAAPELRHQESKFKTYMGRPWKKFSRTVIMQSYLGSLIDPKGWLEWEGHAGDKPYYAEFENRGPGASTNERVKWATVINSTAEASIFTVKKIIQGDKWIPSTGIPYYLGLL